MKKLIYSLMVAGLLMSCKNVEKDAQTIADFKCLMFEATSEQEKQYEVEIEKISTKYSGEDLAKIKTLANQLYEKCPAKIESDKQREEFEKQTQDLMKDMRTEYMNDAIYDATENAKNDAMYNDSINIY